MTTLFNLITRALQRLFPNHRLANLERELATLKERSVRQVETACEIISTGIREVTLALSKRIDHLADRIEEGATARDATNELVRRLGGDPSAIAEHLDLADLADNIDASDIAGHFDHSAIAGEIDIADIAGHIDAGDIADEIDLAQLAGHLDLTEIIPAADNDDDTSQSIDDLEATVAAQAVDIAALRESIAAMANDLQLVTQAAEAFATALRPGDEADWAGFDND
jgi:hypothetical protein